MTTYSRLHQGMLGVLGGALLMTSLGCSTPLSTREKGALVGGGTGAGVGALVGGWPGAAIGGALGAGGGALVGNQMQKQDLDEDRRR
jgi:outer membrane protein with glycine zipper